MPWIQSHQPISEIAIGAIPLDTSRDVFKSAHAFHIVPRPGAMSGRSSHIGVASPRLARFAASISSRLTR